jgi:hypothetical protein
VFGTVVVAATFTILVVAFAIRSMRRAREAAAPAEIALLVAEPLARRTMHARTAEVAACAALFVAGWSLEVYPLVLVGLLVAIAGNRLLEARRVVKLLDEPQAGAELRGTTLTACAHGTAASIRVSARAIARAKQHGVPRSVARS